MSVEIRRAHPADAATLSHIAHAAKRYWGYPEEYIRLWKRDLTVTPEFIDAHVVYNGVRGTEILGFYALTKNHSSYELEHLWVLPEHIGEGIGSSLFDHAVQVVRSEGGAALNIVSDPYAGGFYQKKGAIQTGMLSSRPEGRRLPVLTLYITGQQA